MKRMEKLLLDSKKHEILILTRRKGRNKIILNLMPNY